MKPYQMSLLLFYTTLMHTMRLKAAVKALSQKPGFGAKFPPSINQNRVKNAGSPIVNY